MLSSLAVSSWKMLRGTLAAVMDEQRQERWVAGWRRMDAGRDAIQDRFAGEWGVQLPESIFRFWAFVLTRGSGVSPGRHAPGGLVWPPVTPSCGPWMARPRRSGVRMAV
jgi:hypothetical protein